MPKYSNMKWDSTAHEKLLMGMLKYTKLGKQGYEELAVYMGDGCTSMAIQKHFQKLRAMYPDDNTQGGPPSTPTKGANGTPKTPKARTPRSAKTDGSRTGAKKRKVPDSGSDEDYNDGSPVKREKVDKPVVKLENVDGEEEGNEYF
ncbi:hypothetical protein FQN50_006354 [Emmonsiellopsis sp. PD_5]|nr:hypothetical protein FQN50_006354 [Emmonsiellopsis sp. PD_5]